MADWHAVERSFGEHGDWNSGRFRLLDSLAFVVGQNVYSDGEILPFFEG
jgi:hypothetical protein